MACLALAALAAFAAGCSAGPVGPEATPTRAATPAPSPAPSPTPTAGPTWPLTGEPAASPLGPPVLVVKVDNTAAARPQLGLAAADLVVEEPVEGGLTRLAVMVHSRLPAEGPLLAGPVRSVRTSDVGIVSPTGGVLVASGGAGPALDAVRAAGIRTALDGSPGFAREPTRRAPYDLLVDLGVLAGGYPAQPLAPPYLLRGDPADLPPGRPVSSVQLRFSGASSTTLAWTGSGWVRAGPPDGFVATSVLALLLPVADAGYLDSAGNRVPELVTQGSGDGILTHAGQVWDLRWSKATAGAPWLLTGPDGAPLPVPPGPLYLALLPLGAGSVTTG